jgi:hypothetical protein
MFCSQIIKVISLKSFKEHFLDFYLETANDKIPEVRVAFLNYAPAIRPYFE